jgi:RNA polymerase sigma-70 factor, ECF subfamily
MSHFRGSGAQQGVPNAHTMMMKPQRLLARSSVLRPVREVAPCPDAELVARALRGDKGAETEIYARHVGHVLALCTRLLGRRDEAEDATQDTFVDVLEQLGQLRDPERLRHWIGRVAVHKVHRRFRRRKLQRLLGMYSPIEPDFALVPAPSRASPEQAALLGRIPDTLRAAWLLCRVEGYKLEEVADLCGCSLATVKRRIALADAEVRRSIPLDEADDDVEVGDA